MYTKEKIKLKLMKPAFGLIGKKLPKTNLHLGSDSVLEVAKIIKDKEIKRVLVITDEILLGLGLLTPMLDRLAEEEIEFTVYKDVKPDPTFTIVNEALAVCKKNDAQAIIAFGGGSVLDTSKTVAASAANNYIDPRKLEGMMKVKKQPLPFIAIPTTAGTGSEVTIVAVVSDPDTHQKMTIVDPKLIASETILDPQITIGLPPHITSTTGLDAFTHAIEAYVSGFANQTTDELALKAIKLISQNIETTYNEPKNIEARQNLLLASMYAGEAFTRTYVGYVHAFSHNIGGKYGVPHGLANAVLLPYVMQDTKKEAQNRFAQIADVLEISNKTMNSSEKADAFIEYLFKLNQKLNIPKRLEAFDPKGIEQIIDGAFKEAHGTYPVPRYYTRAEAKVLLEKVCHKQDLN